MRVAVGGDHAGFEMKNLISEHVKSLGHTVVDAGAYEYDALDDFPDFSEAVAVRVADGRAERGLIVCGSGVGASVAANKVRGIRAGSVPRHLLRATGRRARRHERRLHRRSHHWGRTGQRGGNGLPLGEFHRG